MIQRKHLTVFLSTFLYTTLMGLPCSTLADDTEIYTDSPSSTGIANILFILDTSGSMGSKVDENNNGTIDTGERSRIVVLKEAMNTLLDTMPALNVGLMRYHYYGGPILFPVSNLNAIACVIEGNCPVAGGGLLGNQVLTSLISDNNDDAVEDNATGMTLNGNALDIGERVAGSSCTDVTANVTIAADDDAMEEQTWDPSTHTVSGSSLQTNSDMEIPRDNNVQQLNGLWFRNVNIPAGKTITDARITFTVDNQRTAEAFDVDVRAVDPFAVRLTNKDFNATGFKPSDLYANIIGPAVEWTDGQNPVGGQTLTTSNIAGLVQAIIDDADWPTASLNMTFLIEDDDANTIDDGFRDYERTANSGHAVLSVTYQNCVSTIPANVRSGLRYQAVNIPQGAIINSARIDFTATAADDISSGTAGVADGPDFIIKMENAADAAPIGTANGNLSGRTYLTTNVPWTAATTPTLGSPNGVDWAVDTVYATPDLAAMMQEVVNRADWCGGNDLLFMLERSALSDDEKRSAYSTENDPAKAPQLSINYDADNRHASAAAGNPDGCSTSTITRTIIASSDDAEEGSNGAMDLGSSDLEMIYESATGQQQNGVGLRYQDIPIAKNSTIVSAKLTFTVDEVDSGPMTLTVIGQASDDAGTFVSGGAGTNDISNTTTRPRTATSVSWSPPDFASVNAKHELTGLEGIIQEIVNRGGWVAGNDVAFIITGSGTTTRVAKSFDIDNAANTPVLSITFQGDPVNTASTLTVRERLKGVVDSLDATGGTPIMGAMIEAAKYYRGESVLFGRQRGTQTSSYATTTVSHAASYQANGATVTFPGACTIDNLSHTDCSTQVIADSTKNPIYKSPILAECQTNYIINLTDGAGYFTGDGRVNTLNQSIDEDNVAALIAAEDASANPVTLGACAANTILSDGSTFSDTAHNECLVRLSKFLQDNDQIYTNSQLLQSGTAPIDGLQNIKTYTIGFNLCGSGKVTSADASGAQVCCAVANHNAATGVCSSPVADPTSITVLKAMADVGDGEYFNANTAEDLLNAFTDITSNIVQRATSFVAPSIAANAFNRLFSRDEVYFGLFEPDRKTRWQGNVKKYAVCATSDPDGVANSGDECTLGDVLDATGVNAIVDDPSQADDGLFKTTSTSDWTNVAVSPDGRTITAGGAGGEIADFTTRTAYTEVNDTGIAASGTSLGTAFELNSTKWNDLTFDVIRDKVCPVNSVDTATADGVDCRDRMLYMLGKDIFDEDGDPLTDTRWWFHDVLHSSPEIVTYGLDDKGDVDPSNDEFIDKVIVATNDGGLHMINGLTGTEDWVFMPNELFLIQSALYNNSGTNHTYGIDSTPVIRIIDVNGDGTIDPAFDNDGNGSVTAAEGDKVYAYVSQRRGGRNIYALDITPSSTLTNNTTKIVPKLLWRIQGGIGDFARMGQSWSEPRLGRIQAGTTGAGVNQVPLFKDVLIYGGGYDIDVDGTDAGGNFNFGIEAGNPNEGNGIYIVDAGTGGLIFWVSSDTTTAMSSGGRTGADIVATDMKYSIPSNVTILDTNGDNITDRVYVGDTAGQVWRLDIADDVDPGGTAPEGSSVIGKLASISTAGTVADERRFYFAPSVVQVLDTAFSNAVGGEFDYVLLPTGYRAHPLDKNIKDRFYAFRDSTVDPMVDASPVDGIADDYPRPIDIVGGTSRSGAPIDNTDLEDISTSALTASAKTQLGWYFDFNIAAGSPAIATGEKGLAAPAVFAGTLIFTTFTPSDANAIVDICSASEGKGNAFNFNILTGNASLDWDGDGDIDLADREYALGSGIPSEAVPIFTKEGVTVLVGTGGGAENLGKVSGLPRYRTYWYEEG